MKQNPESFGRMDSCCSWGLTPLCLPLLDYTIWSLLWGSWSSPMSSPGVPMVLTLASALRNGKGQSPHPHPSGKHDWSHGGQKLRQDQGNLYQSLLGLLEEKRGDSFLLDSTRGEPLLFGLFELKYEGWNKWPWNCQWKPIRAWRRRRCCGK